MRTPGRGTGVALAVVAGLLGAGTAALAASGTLSSDGTTTIATNASRSASSPTVPAAVRAVPTDLAQAIGVLAQPKATDDVMPTGAVERITTHADLGENVALARHALTTSSGERYFVVPANGSVCVYDQNAGGGCLTNGDAEMGRLIGVDLCAPHLSGDDLRVYGLVPNGVKSVTLARSDGSLDEATVENNMYSVTLARDSSALPTTVSWRGPDGEHTQHVPLPPDAAAGCG